MRLHDALDTLVAAYLNEHPDKRPSTTTVLELLEWSAARAAAGAGEAIAAEVASGVRCARCQQFLSASRIAMRITRCSKCDGHGGRRQ